MASERHDDPGPAEREAYRSAQREAVLEAANTYLPGAPVLVGVEFGHTSPQWVLPYGGRMTLDGAAKRLFAHYGDRRP